MDRSSCGLIPKFQATLPLPQYDWSMLTDRPCANDRTSPLALARKPHTLWLRNRWRDRGWCWLFSCLLVVWLSLRIAVDEILVHRRASFGSLVMHCSSKFVIHCLHQIGNHSSCHRLSVVVPRTTFPTGFDDAILYSTSSKFLDI